MLELFSFELCLSSTISVASSEIVILFFSIYVSFWISDRAEVIFSLTSFLVLPYTDLRFKEPLAFLPVAYKMDERKRIKRTINTDNTAFAIY